MLYVKGTARITNAEYQRLCQVSKRTASDELGALEAQGLLERVGTRGKGTYYQLKGQQKGEMGNKWATKGQRVNKEGESNAF
jgi:ATP-dependent DNA helicase RecG